MSSLINQASIWVNDDPPKKRIPTMNKTLKSRTTTTTNGGGSLDDSNMNINQTAMLAENYQNLQPATIDETQNYNQDRSSKVAELLNKITSTSTVEENSKMGNFQPIDPPTINSRKDLETPSSWRKPIDIENAREPGRFNSNSTHTTTNMSNYNQIYQPPVPLGNSPYYAKMGIGSGGSPSMDKMMEKMNYMIHLLEEQQYEKTNNITEEFILYSFLGIFMIFIVDSFSRSARYTR
jgi:hypothetical protein